jgi:hypothetical protein
VDDRLAGGGGKRDADVRRDDIDGVDADTQTWPGTCRAGLTAILLVIGIMDLRAMSVVTATITVERLAPLSASRARSEASSSGQGRS